MKSSGLLFTPREDGSVVIGFEEYEVGCLGGEDYEVMYHLDASNFKLLMKKLSITSKNQSKIKDALIAEFGKEFDTGKFEQLCEAEHITFKKSTYIG